MSQQNALVVGASSLVGRFLAEKLAAQGIEAFGLCRTPPSFGSKRNWISADLEDPDTLRNKIPPTPLVFSTGPLHLFAAALDVFAEKGVTRIVAFSSTSADSKLQSETEQERIAGRQFIDGERRLIDFCDKRDIAWTILRPTLIYVEGFDRNVTRIAHFIQRFRFFPLAGTGKGLRQPVHGADLAEAATQIALLPEAPRGIYNLSGGETLSYAEMVGRIFDGMGMRRRVIPVPIPIWKLAFSVAGIFLPGATSAMGSRMSQDLIFDSSGAARDFGWDPRAFHPLFANRSTEC